MNNLSLPMYDLTTAPKGRQYQTLLEFAMPFCSHFLLIVRPGIHNEPLFDVCRNQLQRFLVHESQQSEWPGTRLLESTALVSKYTFSQDVVVLLNDLSPGLMNWCQPKRPEDLCLIRWDESPFLTTIAHENMAYFTVTKEEEAALLSHPFLGTVIEKYETDGGAK